MPTTVLVKAFYSGSAPGLASLMGDGNDGNEIMIMGCLRFEYVLKVEDVDMFIARSAIYCKKHAGPNLSGKIEVWRCLSEIDFTPKEQIISIEF